MNNDLAHSNIESIRDEISTQSLSESEFYRLFASTERRAAMLALEEVPRPTDLRGLAYATADHLEDIPAPNPDAIDHVALRLHHVHLPKLDDAGFVDYVPQTNEIR